MKVNDTKDQIYGIICKSTKNYEENDLNELTASYLSSKLNVSRTIVSQYLNELVKEGIVVKTNSRPVYFFEKENLANICGVDKEIINEVISLQDLENKFVNMKRSCFEKAIGCNTSINYAIEQCKAAMKYPPNGLPILLNGPTGAGKSYMANLIYEYAIEEKIIERDKAFITVNCSEYANNPELLTANLFGYKKGAFTGAQSDNIGLIKSANGGVLFLDEVHSLTPECQEKLFVFMDKGTYHLLGDNEAWHTARVKIIFATSKNPNETLLKTLIRRIPVIVKLPSLEERSIEEKEEIIIMTIRNEQKRIGKKIYISNQVFNALMSYTFTGNIGQMKDCIRIGCANAYLYQNSEEIKVCIFQMPDYIIKESGFSEQKANIIDNNMLDIDLLSKKNGIEHVIKLYEDIIKAYMEYNNSNIDLETMFRENSNQVNNYYDYLIYGKTYVNNQIIAIEGVVSAILMKIVDKYNIKCHNNSLVALSRYLYDYTQHNSILKNWVCKNKGELELCFEFFKRTLKNEYTIVLELSNEIHNMLEINLDSINLIILMLNIKMFNTNIKMNETFGVIICHGYTTASSIADAANKLIDRYIFEAIDMPLDCKVDDVIIKLRQLLSAGNLYKDIILLVDMGSLEEIYKGISTISNVNIGVINNITTRLAVDVGLQIINNDNIEEILKKSSENNYCTYKFIENRKKEDAILFISETDMHAAKSMSELFINSFPKNVNVNIIPYEYFNIIKEKKDEKVFKQYNIISIIGSFNPNIDGIPFIAVEDIIAGKSKNKINDILSKYLTEEELDKFNQNILKNFSLQNVLERITILNVKKVLDDVGIALDKLQKTLNIKLQNKTIIALYVHISYLIERLVKKNPIKTHNGLDKFMGEQIEFIKIVKESFSVVEKHYSVEIPVSEIAYIHDFVEANKE